VFTKKDVLDGLIDHQFEYARGAASEPFDYEFSETWSYVGQKPKEGKFSRSSSGSHTLMPEASSTMVVFNGNSYALSENNILGVTAEIRYRFLGKDKTSYMNVFADDDSRPQATLFLDNDARTFAYRTVFTHADHGELAMEWERKPAPSDGPVAIHARIPAELRDEDAGFISTATQAVGKEANRKLDDVLSEYDQL